ncbi:helix-turn-helix domain-containing protein [Sorangium sp. So ce426]|uniref:helix-turn-helix domain-containing protein n=1 Tax=Sorangium sp. So ce426 TaxID=3133312 RepID=UPI003F5C5EB8
MNASDAIKERVDRFVKDILSLVERVQDEHRAAAHRTVTTMLADLGRPAANASSERRPKPRKQPAHAKRSVAKPTRSVAKPTRSVAKPTRSVAKPTRSVAKPTRSVAKQGALSGASSSSTTAPSTRTTSAPASGADRTTAGTTTATGASTSDREAVVLETVRALVRGTATEIATRSGLPNGSVYVTLRALVARGRVARAGTARGAEYSLVSSGGIRPFKRVKAARPTSPAEMEQTADAALAE